MPSLRRLSWVVASVETKQAMYVFMWEQGGGASAGSEAK